MWVVTRVTPDFSVDLTYQTFGTSEDACIALESDAIDRATEEYGKGVAEMMFEPTAAETNGVYAVWKDKWELVVYRVEECTIQSWFTSTRHVERTMIARYKVHELYARASVSPPPVQPHRQIKKRDALPKETDAWQQVVDELKTKFKSSSLSRHGSAASA